MLFPVPPEKGTPASMAFTLFGLTGGIACGKSTVAGFFARRGVPVIDADLVARQVVAPGTEGLSEIVGAFGAEILSSDGTLDRTKMASIVFADTRARRRLEAITHPRIRERTVTLAAELSRQGHTIAAYEAALLVEKGLTEMFRPLVVVAVDPEVQVRRLMVRDGASEIQARSRLEAQMPIAEKLGSADFVIDTSGTLEQVEQRTMEVLASICERVGADASRYA